VVPDEPVYSSILVARVPIYQACAGLAADL
jgi:hypothetical protein